jgi:hypothetical protein
MAFFSDRASNFLYQLGRNSHGAGARPSTASEAVRSSVRAVGRTVGRHLSQSRRTTAMYSARSMDGTPTAVRQCGSDPEL